MYKNSVLSIIQFFKFLRRILFLIVWLTITTNSILANDPKDENSDKEKAQYGIKAGINFAELWGEDAIPESDRKIGYSLGAYASFKISKEWKIQPELIWSLQGENSDDKGRYKMSYLNIPIMFKWKSKKFYTEIGPQLGILTISTSKSVPDEFRLENFETFDFSINGGFGYEITEDWSVGIRYCQGLTNIVRNRNLKNSVIYIGVAYSIF